MNKTKVINELRRLYPGKNIVMNDADKPTEIICEINSFNENSDESVAVAVVDTVINHYHQNITETYEVQKGNLIITINGKQTTLTPGQKITIHPGDVHSAEGHESWIKFTSRPAWRPDDHYVVVKNDELRAKT